MGNFAAHVWTITITFIIAIVALLVWYFGYADLNNTLYADNLQDATRTALYAAQDRADRTERGSFVINKTVFGNVLGHTSVKQFDGKTVDDMTHTKIYYLPDNAKADMHDSDDNSATGSNLKDPISNKTLGHHHVDGQDDNQLNNHNVSTGSAYKEGTNESRPWISGHDSNEYETIRGIRVVVDGPTPSNLGFHSENRLKQTGHGNYGAGFHGHHTDNNNNDDSNRDDYSVEQQAKNNDNYDGNGDSSDNQHDILTQFTATDIIQTFGKNASNDSYNDLTR